MRRFYRKVGCLLGLLAILMATLAPTISHTLAASRADTMPEAHCDMPAMQDGMPMPDDDKSSPHTAMPDGQDCGYCSLLAHMPGMPSVPALFFVVVRAVQQRVATRFYSVRRVEPHTLAQPRAPPILA